MEQVNEDNIELATLVQDVINTYEEGMANSDIQIHLELDRAVPKYVRCDPSMLRTVVSNLLANAVQHSDADSITIARTYQPPPLPWRMIQRLQKYFSLTDISGTLFFSQTRKSSTDSI